MTFSLRKKFMYYFPEEYCNQPNTAAITDINLEYNHFDKLPRSFQNFHNLQILNLGNNSLIKVPQCIAKLKNIEAIAFHQNNLTSLPQDLNWEKLKCINLSHNYYISYLPCSEQWHQIKYINCNRNRIVFLAHFNWPLLEILRMNHNFIHFLDDSLKHCHSIRKVDLSFNKIKSATGLIHLNHITDINLSHNEIKELEINNLPVLRTLNLSHNHLNNESLQNIDWSRLTSLQTLDLSHNHIDNLNNIPWDQLTQLRVLKLDHNNLEQFPTIFNLNDLVTLTISHNHIRQVPDEIGGLRNVSLLDLSNNLITELPNTMGNMFDLEELYISNNRLTTLPQNLVNCNQLGYIQHTGNDGLIVSQEILNHLQRRLPNNHNNFNLNNVNTTADQNVKVYSDPQSVHNVSIQQDIRKVITDLMKDNAMLDEEQVVVLVTDDNILTQKTKRILINFCADTTTHCTTLNVNFAQILAAVWEKMLKLKQEYQNEVKKIMEEEMTVSEDKCFTGRVSRLVGCLQGFIEGIEIGISEPEQINNIILMVKKQLKNKGELSVDNWKQEFRKEMEERNYPTKTIDEYEQFIDLDD